MASSQHVEVEAAKLLQKLIQESKDEPAKLATKLYVICQHMKLSGKEQSLPYQVISRAMETVVNQHGIDMDALRSSRVPFAGGPQAVDSSGVLSKDKEIIGSQSPMVGSDASQGSGQAALWQFPSGSTDMTRHGVYIPGRVPTGQNRGDVAGSDIHQGSMSQKSGRSSGIESPASLQMEDTRSMNSHDSLKSDEKTSKKASSSKRKRMDSKATGDMQSEDNSKSDAISSGQNIRKKKQLGKAGTQGQPSKGVEPEQSHLLQGTTAQVPPLPGGASFIRAHQESSPASAGRSIDNTKPSNPFAMSQVPNFAEGLASGSIPAELQKGILGGANMFNSGFGWNQNPQGSVIKNTQGPVATLMRPGVNVEGKINVGLQGAFNPTPTSQMDFPTNSPYMSSSFGGGSQFLDKGKDLASGNTGTELHSAAKVGVNVGGGIGQRGNESRVADGSARENGNSQEISATFGSQSDLSRLPSTSAGSIAEADSSMKDSEIIKKETKIAEHEKSSTEGENIQHTVVHGSGSGSVMRPQEIVSPVPSGPQQSYFQGDKRRNIPEIHRTDEENLNRNLISGAQGPSSLGGNRQHPNLEAAFLAKDRLQDEASKQSFPPPRLHHMPDGYNSNLLGKDQTPETDRNGVEQGIHMGEISDRSADEGDDDLSEHDGFASTPPKYTITEKWIFDYQKRKYEENEKKVLGQQKAHKRMAASYQKLKENVSSSGDLTAKTKSVIELKKLQLLPLQRRVRSEFLLDFFKPNTAELERVKAVKKHRHGRRVKQLEKIEQKMKEERQKRIRERQKEFFADIESHREKLEDSFKAKRERLKGFNRYVKEFHKRKERIHREKLDRIQREKINLLKNNDVEGYLRMVKDAKSDRVKQLLRETEKYLQKLGAKLRGDSSMDGRSYVSGKSVTANDVEDENYQPQNYLESNEKYYQLAHRYQMNGLRWLVSLYNNNLNGILADEMGLGKTVQVESELPGKIERLVRCEASAYQKLLITRVEDNLGGIGAVKVRSVHNSVMEMRNICNHPYLSQLHVEEIEGYLPRHYLPSIVRLCGKLEMLDRLLPKLKATGHRVLLFSTMTRLLDVMEDYLVWKKYKYLRLDGHTSGHERGALIDKFNDPNSPAFIFLLSIRAGGVGVNLQAADTVIIFDTDWNPQVDLQAQARAHRIGQKKEVLVLRLETVRTVEEQVRASAEHKLGVANQSITAGFFDNNTSAEDRKEYLESLLRECKKEESAPVLDDDALNNILARSEDEIDIFESIDKQRLDEETAVWLKVVQDGSVSGLDPSVMPSRLVSDDDLKSFCHAMKIYESSNVKSVKVNVRRKGELGGLDTKHYGRGKRAREVRSYEDQWTEEEFEKLCQSETPDSPQPGSVLKDLDISKVSKLEVPAESSIDPVEAKIDPVEAKMDPVPAVPDSSPAKRRRGRPKRSDVLVSPVTSPAKAVRQEAGSTFSSSAPASTIDSSAPTATIHSTGPDVTIHSAQPVSAIRPEIGTEIEGTAFVSAVPTATMKPEIGTEVKDCVVLEGSIAKEVATSVESGHDMVAASVSPHPPAPPASRGRKTQAGEIPRRRGRKPKSLTLSSADDVSAIPVVAISSGASSVDSPYPQGAMSSAHASGVSSFQKDMVTDRPVTLLPQGLKGIATPEGIPCAAEDIHAAIAVTSENASSLPPKIVHNENIGFVQASSEQVPSASLTMPVVSAGILKASHVLLADKPAEKQGASRRRRKKASGSEDTGVSTRQRSAMKKSYGTPGATDNVGADISTADELRIVKGRDGSSLQDTSKELPDMNSSPYDKSGYDSQPRTPIAVPISEATLPGGFDDAHIEHSDINPRISTNSDVQDKPVKLPLGAHPAVAAQTSSSAAYSEVTTIHSGTVTDKSLLNPVSESANVQFEPPDSSLHSVKDINTVPLDLSSVTPNKAPGRRRKGSACEPRTRSKSATAACERRARLAGSKQTGDAKILEILANPSTTVSVSSVEQQGTAPAELLISSVCQEQKKKGASVDVTSWKQDTMIVEALQTDDISGGSASHLHAALQGSSENSCSKLLASGNKTEEMEGTLDKNQEKKDHPETEKKDSTTLMLADRQNPFDASDKDTKDTLAPTEADASDLHSDGASVGVTSPKQNSTIVETLQTEDISGCSASHLPVLQSADSNQPAGQKGSSENSGSKTVAQTNDDTDSTPAGRCSPSEDKKEDSCAHVGDGGDLVVSKQIPAEALNALLTHLSKDASVVEVMSINDATSACEVKKDPDRHVSVPVPVSAATNTGDDSKEAHSVPSTHSDREASMVEVGASRNGDTSVRELRKGPESNVSGELAQAGLLERKLELNQSQSFSQSSAISVEETNASYTIQTSVLESERKSPGNFAHGTPEGIELAGPKIECTIQMPSPDEKSTEVHSLVQVEMVSAAEQASTKDDKEHKPVDVTVLSGGEQEILQVNADNSIDEGAKDHCPETSLADSQSLCEVSDKDVVPTKDDRTDMQTEGNIAGMNAANQDSAETEAMQIDGIPEGSSSDLPAALQPAGSNLPAEQDGLENSASIAASPNEHEKLKETSSETGGDNLSCSRADDDSHAVNLVGYSPSEGSDEDSAKVAEAGDLEGSKETTLDVVSAIAGGAEPSGGSSISRGAEPEPVCETPVHVQEGISEAADPEDGSTMDQGSVQVSTAEPEAKKDDDAPTQKENVESAAIESEAVEHAGTEADLSKEASMPPQKETLVTGAELNEEANTSALDEKAVEPVATVPDHLEHASTEQPGEDLKVLNTQSAPVGETSNLGQANTEQLLQTSSGEDMAITGAKTEHACGTSDQKEVDVAADESPAVAGEEVLNTEIAPDGKTPKGGRV
ncbi:hypothetical protein ACQ4PT_023792 [Festuca glaucescens]